MNKIFYKNWIWYYHLFWFIILLVFLLLGIYWCVITEFWYIEESFLYNSSLLNYDVLMSFLSVQVNIITIVWLFIYVVKFNSKNYFTSLKFRRMLLNWNTLNLIVFWIAMIIVALDDENGLVSYISIYTDNQILCTVITHLICPLALIFIYPFVSGKEYYKYKDLFKGWEIYITFIYPVLYTIYVWFRGEIYETDNMEAMKWPYPFLDFDNLLLDVSTGTYVFLLYLAFGCWFTAQHYLMIFINNIIYKFKNKNKEFIYEEVKPIIKLNFINKKVSK